MSINWGDAPTWVAAIFGGSAAFAVYWQLRLQREQLSDQQKVIKDEFERNTKRDELVDRQLRELELRERVIVRQQAEQIDIEFADDSTPPRGIELAQGDQVHVVIVENRSARPIRHLAAKIDPTRSGGFHQVGGHRRLVELEQQFPSPHTATAVFDSFVEWDRVVLVPRDNTYMLVSPFSTRLHPSPAFRVRFTDDAGLRWEVDQDLHLERLDDQSGW